MSKSYSGWRRLIRNWSTKFELNPINTLSANAPKWLDQSGTRKWWKFSRLLPNDSQHSPPTPPPPHPPPPTHTPPTPTPPPTPSPTPPKEFAHHIWTLNLRFVWKWVETAWQIKGIQQSIIIIWTTLRTSILYCTELFERQSAENWLLSQRGASGLSTPEAAEVWCGLLIAPCKLPMTSHLNSGIY